MLMGELSLDGTVLPLRGTAYGLMAKSKDSRVCSSAENAKEAAVVKGLDIYAVKNIREVVDFQ